MRFLAQLCRQIFRCSFSVLIFFPNVLLATTPCKLPGEILIGEDKSYYYCSRKSCPQLSAQLDSDKRALDRLRSAIVGSNAELQEWTEQNGKAEKAALEHAKQFLIGTVLSGITENRQTKLDEIVKNTGRADPIGTTWKMKLAKAADFERSYARLVTLIAALKLVQYPGMDIQEAWADFKGRAKQVGKEAHVLAATWDLLATDPDARQAFKEHGFEFSADTLKQALSLPVLSEGIDLGQFILVDYGYDAAQWELSRERIMQNLAAADSNLYAECLLSRQMLITFRDYNICRGKMPNIGGPRPEDIKCTDHSVPK